MAGRARCVGGMECVGECSSSYSDGTTLSSGVEVEGTTIKTCSIGGRVRLLTVLSSQHRAGSDVKLRRSSDKHRTLRRAATRSCLWCSLLVWKLMAPGLLHLLLSRPLKYANFQPQVIDRRRWIAQTWFPAAGRRYRREFSPIRRLTSALGPRNDPFLDQRSARKAWNGPQGQPEMAPQRNARPLGGRSLVRWRETDAKKHCTTSSRTTTRTSRPANFSELAI